MTQPAPGSGSGGGAAPTSTRTSTAGPVVNNAPAKPAPPPNPKIQAVDFALQLATVNSTILPKSTISVSQLLSDAAAIDAFLGESA